MDFFSVRNLFSTSASDVGRFLYHFLKITFLFDLEKKLKTVYSNKRKESSQNHANFDLKDAK